MAKQGGDNNQNNDPNLGRDQGDPKDAKTAFEQNQRAKICYINKQGDWCFSNPDKTFGEVVRTLTRDSESGKISEQNGFRQHLEHIKSDEENKRNGRKDEKK